MSVAQSGTARSVQSSSADTTIASDAHVLFCFQVLSAHFAGREPPSSSFDVHTACPLFVTWKTQAHSTRDRHSRPTLRGCIGSLKPLSLSTGLRDYALRSALHDRRFAPIRAEELAGLSCTVQLLGAFERCDLHDWTVGVHGVSISFVDGSGVSRSAVYLPEVAAERGWDQQQTLDSLIAKSGCAEAPTPTLRRSLVVTRFTSTSRTLPYDAYDAYATGLDPIVGSCGTSATSVEATQPSHSTEVNRETCVTL